MDWDLKTETLVSQLLNGNHELFKQLADAAWFSRTLDDQSRSALAKAVAEKFDRVNDVDIKGCLLRLLSWSDSELAYEVALKNLESAARAAVQHSQYLYDSVLVIARERTDLFDGYCLTSGEIKKNLRLSFALLRNKPIIDGDCLEADELSNSDFAEFMKNLRERKTY